MLTLSVLLCLGLSQVMGQYGGGYGGRSPMMYGMKGHMGGGHHSNYMMDHSHDDAEPLLLNCLSTFVDVNGAVTSALAVNIEEKTSSSSSHHGMGHMMGGKMGYGMGGYGGMGYGNRFGMMGGKMGYGMGGYGKGNMMGGHGMSNQGNGLEADVQIVSNVAGGTGFVVFTERANPAEGCTADNFGDVMVSSMMNGNHMGGGHMGGMVNPMMKMGMGGYGKYAYGMGGYGLMGAGYGMGMGMGHKMGGMYGSHHGSNNNDEAGIVAELNILPSQLTSASIDDLGFKSLRDLAGRGVVICSEVTYDSNWVPTCKEPYFSCCALKYDDKKAVIA